MPQEPLNEPATVSSAEPRHRLRVARPTIKILLYTDDPNRITEGKGLLGLGSMRRHLLAHEPASADFGVRWVSRNSDVTHHADNRIDKVLRDEVEITGKPFDEIWFFGLHQVNRETFSLGAFPGGPKSELSQEEVTALQLWMEASDKDEAVGGGVLMTGDHSDERLDGAVFAPDPPCPSNAATEPFLGLGRAISRCVPRAGLMRKWEGGPTTSAQDSHNTVAGGGIQHDKLPQKVTHRNVDSAGDPDPAGQPHPLFFYKPGSFIDFLPDHAHEGALIEEFDPAAWPPGVAGQSQPLPQVVAFGINHRDSTRLSLISAYNGDRAGVGRIVADSSWHHYLNINLLNFPHPAPEGSPADQIGQFYGNLALWLAPRSKRREMAHTLFWEIADYTLLMGEGGDDLSLGAAGFAILSQVASPCEIHELMQVLIADRIRTPSFLEKSLSLSHLPSVELLLGGVLNSYHREMLQAERGRDSFQPRAVDAVIDSGVMRAIRIQAEQLGLKASEALRLASLDTA